MLKYYGSRPYLSPECANQIYSLLHLPVVRVTLSSDVCLMLPIPCRKINTGHKITFFTIPFFSCSVSFNSVFGFMLLKAIQLLKIKNTDCRNVIYSIDLNSNLRVLFPMGGNLASVFILWASVSELDFGSFISSCSKMFSRLLRRQILISQIHKYCIFSYLHMISFFPFCSKCFSSYSFSKDVIWLTGSVTRLSGALIQVTQHRT